MRFVIPVLFVLSVPLLAQAPVPRYEVHRAPGRIVIDGTADEPAWAAASPAAELVARWESQTGPKQATAARMLWDDERLYLTYEVEDADITAVFTNRDDPTYRDDAVEIFINPKPDQTGLYYGLEMNARAVVYDYVSYLARTYVKRFNLEGLQVMTSLRGTLNARGDHDEGWSLEAAIPFVNFEEMAPPPSIGTIWTANLNRWDGVAPARRMSIWSDPIQARAQPHVPERFGQLVFVD